MKLIVHIITCLIIKVIRIRMVFPDDGREA